jgi:hypothetical protein
MVCGMEVRELGRCWAWKSGQPILQYRPEGRQRGRRRTYRQCQLWSAWADAAASLSVFWPATARPSWHRVAARAVGQVGEIPASISLPWPSMVAKSLSAMAPPQHGSSEITHGIQISARAATECGLWATSSSTSVGCPAQVVWKPAAAHKGKMHYARRRRHGQSTPQHISAAKYPSVYQFARAAGKTNPL